jgi:undecaprenyl-diphosphatase
MNAILHLAHVVHDSDLRVTGRVYAWRPAPWICALTVGTTRLGDGWAWLAVACLLAAGGRAYHRTLAVAAIAGALASIVFTVLKRRIRRPRPCDLAQHPVFQVLPPDRFSFPSGHTINAFAITTVLALQWPLFSPALALLAAGIGASRVLLGLHYVSDVLAGAVLGILIGLSVGIAFLA